MTSPPFTEAKARAWIKRMRLLKFSGADFVEWMTDQIWPARPPDSAIAKRRDEINELRRACRGEGSPRIQAAWDAVEEHIDFAYRAGSC